MMAKRQSRGDRWQSAVSAAREVLDEQMTAVQQAQTDAEEAISAYNDALQVAMDALQESMQGILDVREEYQEWYDNLPENLQGNSPVSEKLEAVIELDLDVDMDVDEVEFEFEEFDWSEIESLLDEAEQAELPLGFGRD